MPDRTFTIRKRYLYFPVKNGAPKRWVRVSDGPRTVDDFEIEISTGQPDWISILDVSPYRGRTLQVHVDEPDVADWLNQVQESDSLPETHLYAEALRPQFHFTSQRGWLNDPNGLVYDHGKYHLFYQHNPYGWPWGNMHWGHAVSPDLVHWQELPSAITPDAHGTIYSGSAVVDHENTSGLGQGGKAPLVLLYTAAGHTNRESKDQPFTQRMVFSTDHGKTWQSYRDNPILGHLEDENRDPKVVWFAPTRHWVMSLYLTGDRYALFTSPDLKHWTKTDEVRLEGDAECPNFFEIPVADHPGQTKWIFMGAKGIYQIGSFSGQRFHPESKPIALNHGNSFYASQVYTDLPKNRRVLITWGQQEFPGMAFNQKMGLPVDLTLAPSPEGLMLRATPAPELQRLRTHRTPLAARPVDGAVLLNDSLTELSEVELEIRVGTAEKITVAALGIQLEYDTKSHRLTAHGASAELSIPDGILKLHLLIDRATADVFANDGRIYMPLNAVPKKEMKSLSVTTEGGTAELRGGNLYALKSAWPAAPGH